MPRTAKIEEPAGKSHPLPDLSSAVAQSNGPDREEFLFMVGQIAKAEEALKAARDAKKKLRSHFKLRGVDLEQMDRAIDELEREDGTTVDNLRTFKRYCEFLGLPIGSQMTLFDMPQSNGMSQQSLLKHAAEEGYARGVMGKNPDDQAYPPLSPEGQEHMRGWSDGQGVLKEKFIKLSEAMADAEKEKADKKAKKAKSEDDKPAIN